jgi:RHS repeat-associated protein
VQRSFFRPFGEFAQEGGGLSPYLFTDQEHDPESDLQYFGARYYDPWIGRFLSQDPALLGSAAGVTFNRIATDGQQFNAYSYVGNRPTVFVDPSGEFGLLKSVVKLIAKGGDIAGAFSDVVDAKNTVTDPTASIGEKILAVAGAAASLVALGPSDLKVAGRVLGITDKGKDAKRATERRVRLRESTREQIEANQPRNSRGELIDPNTREPLKSDEIDVGHKTGQEWRRRREMHREAGSTRREVIQAENDPDLYQLEDRSSNRGHRFEQR